jgi:hypothetical protein
MCSTRRRSPSARFVRQGAGSSLYRDRDARLAYESLPEQENVSGDHATELVLSIVGAFVVLLVGGILLGWRRTLRREALARTSPIVRATVAGPLLNRRVAVFALPTLLFAMAMGALTAKGGPIPNSSTWAAVLTGLVLVTGAVGAAVSAFRNEIGAIELDRTKSHLRVRIREESWTFDLASPFEFAEFSIAPDPLFTYGGIGLAVRQGKSEASFWYPIDVRSFRSPRPPLLGGRTVPHRTAGLTRVIHEDLRDLALARAAS